MRTQPFYKEDIDESLHTYPVYGDLKDNHMCQFDSELGVLFYNYSIIAWFWLIQHGYAEMALEMGKAMRHVQLPPSVIDVYNHDYGDLGAIIEQGVKQYEQDTSKATS